MTPRSENLLNAVAQRLQDGGDPLAAAFLAEKHLTAMEVERLTGELATIVRGYALAPEFLKRQIRASALYRQSVGRIDGRSSARRLR